MPFEWARMWENFVKHGIGQLSLVHENPSTSCYFKKRGLKVMSVKQRQCIAWSVREEKQ